jgi:crossover junction endodeoxyribonuclease RusA
LAQDAGLPFGLDEVGIEALPLMGTRVLQDAANCIPAVKAAIDGLVDYGLIEDDSPKWLKWINCHASVYSKGVSGLWLRIHKL